ncbi:MAG: hypothetical protein FWC87_15370 [Acidimicrobiaceae bacterium]|nr:hypothetical protein [Acidimicrobiaceae bacterium]
MGTIIGVIVGYTLGTKAGEKGWEEFRDAWKVISTSEEVRDLVTGGLSLGRDLLLRGLAGSGSGNGLRPAA